MRYSVHAPSPPLAGLVDYFWSLSDAPSHSKERVIPSGTIELVVNLHDDEGRLYKRASNGEECARLRGAVVAGAYTGPFAVETKTHTSIVGVHFKPGGAAELLGIPAGALANEHVELEALWGHRAVELRDRLCAAAQSAQRFRILEQALIGSRSQSPKLRGEVGFALGRLGRRGVQAGEVARVARDVRLSHRRLIELFTRQVGMTPKQYSRVRRFHHALASATSSGSPDWAQLALDCGYFDQAHLCHDWAEFTGFSPVELLRLRDVPVKDHHVAVPERPRSNFSNTASSSRR
jgi:AraC-like DNA-binding protein